MAVETPSNERLPKRRRLQYDEPDQEFYENRARNDLHLKSRFEAIFEKYGKDFSATGDEIDLETGEIIVDKGHIQSMANENDVGLETIATVDDESEDDILGSDTVRAAVLVASSDDVELDDQPSPNVKAVSGSDTAQNAGPQQSRQRQPSNQRIAHLHSARREQRKDLVHQPSSFLHSPHVVSDNRPVEEIWQAPPLPQDNIVRREPSSSMLRLREERNRLRSLSPPSGSLWAVTSSGRGQEVEAGQALAIVGTSG